MRVDLLGRTISILAVSKENLEYIAKDKDTHGFYDGIHGFIYIDEALREQDLDRVIRHEIAHAILDITGVSQILKPKQEEAVCAAMENLVQWPTL